MTKTITRTSATGGTITEYFTNGKRTHLVHTAGKAYSGKLAQAEEKQSKTA